MKQASAQNVKFFKDNGSEKDEFSPQIYPTHKERGVRRCLSRSVLNRVGESVVMIGPPFFFLAVVTTCARRNKLHIGLLFREKMKHAGASTGASVAFINLNASSG